MESIVIFVAKSKSNFHKMLFKSTKSSGQIRFTIPMKEPFFLFKKFRSVKIKFHLVGKWLFVGLLRMIEACKQATLLFHVQFATPRDINKIDNKEVLEQQDTMS